MNLILLKIFLIASVVTVQLPDLCGYLFLGRTTDVESNKRTRRIKCYYALWIISYLLWITIVVLYWINPSSVEWFAKIYALDNIPVKAVSIIMMCLGYYLLMFVSVFCMVKHIKLAKGKKIPLITSGIFSYVRHPTYLSIDIAVLGVFLILPNLLSLAMAVCMIASLYGVSLEEEKHLLKIYGQEYQKYQKNVGMFIPKLKTD